MGLNKICLTVVSALISVTAVIGSSCVWDTAQCGGKNYTGLKNCCSAKSVCTKINDYYSKCIPSTSPSCSNKTDSQCGGKNFNGNTCCPSGLKCTYRNEWFSKCMAASSTPSPTPKQTTSSCSNKTDSQCGGKTYTGQTCCPSPLKCTYRNEWFSKCMAPASSPTPSPTVTKKPVTSAPTQLVCDNSETPCGRGSYNGVPTSGDTFCCAIDEECVPYGVGGGRGSSCLRKNRPTTCDPDPCLHNSTCFYGFGAYCLCEDGFSGDFCETPKCKAPEVACGRTSSALGTSPDTTCCSAKEDCVSHTSTAGTTAWKCVTKTRA